MLNSAAPLIQPLNHGFSVSTSVRRRRPCRWAVGNRPGCRVAHGERPALAHLSVRRHSKAKRLEGTDSLLWPLFSKDLQDFGESG